MAQVDKPNVVIPLAASYNERGVNGYAATITNGKDQRKINSVYELVHNQISGKGTLYLRKRPGFPNTGLTVGTLGSTDIPLHIISAPTTAETVWVISKNGNITSASNLSGTTTTILNQSGRWPAWVDSTLISGTRTIVVQIASSDPATACRTYYSTAIGTFTEISDADFTGLVHRGKMEHIDGYALQLTSLNRVHNSDLNSLANWAATSYITKSIEQDQPIGLARLGRVILAFGMETVEGFYNAGNASGSPLARIPQLSTKIGLGYTSLNGVIWDGTTGIRNYYTTIRNVIYFVGRIASSSGGTSVGLYSFNGSTFQKVSSTSLDKILYGASESGSSILNVTTISLEGQFYVAISLDYANAATQKWIMFSPDFNDFFEWNSTFFQPTGHQTYYSGIGGTSAANKLVSLGAAGIDGTNTAYTMTHQFKLPQTGADRKRMHFAGVIGDTQTSASDLSISFSDDDYQTFSTARTIDLTKDKKQIYRCGNYRGRAVKLEHSANTDCRLEAFIARVE